MSAYFLLADDANKRFFYLGKCSLDVLLDMNGDGPRCEHAWDAFLESVRGGEEDPKRDTRYSLSRQTAIFLFDFLQRADWKVRLLCDQWPNLQPVTLPDWDEVEEVYEMVGEVNPPFGNDEEEEACYQSALERERAAEQEAHAAGRDVCVYCKFPMTGRRIPVGFGYFAHQACWITAPPREPSNFRVSLVMKGFELSDEDADYIRGMSDVLIRHVTRPPPFYKRIWWALVDLWARVVSSS